MAERPVVLSTNISVLVGALLLLGLYLTSHYSYLLFHSLAEVFSIVVACGIFMVAWNARQFLDNDYLLFIGIAYLFVAGLDLLHTLAYHGMGVFPGFGANLPTQLWIASRYVQSLSLLVAPVFIHRRLNPHLVFLSYAIVISLLLVSIFYWNIFPNCYIEGMGLTPFKKTSEYIISLILVASRCERNQVSITLHLMNERLSRVDRGEDAAHEGEIEENSHQAHRSPSPSPPPIPRKGT